MSTRSFGLDEQRLSPPHLIWMHDRARTHPDPRPLDRAGQRFLDGLLTAEEPSSSIERYAIEQLLVEMSDALLLSRLGTAPTNPREQTRHRATAVITQQCSDPRLTPTAVARGIGTSLSQLQTAFAEAGTTVAEEIRRQRAALAHSLLTDEKFDALSIDQIARFAGFGSPMSMRRALFQQYGATPSGLRCQGAASRVELEPEGRRHP